ncbi:MAG: CDP-alcohol phosphatidyltransferase family protein [Bryobacterales bacterium]
MPESSQRTISTVEPASGRTRALFSQILSVPNQLTLIRMLLVPFILISMIYEQHDVALYLVLAAALTDGFDGLVARHFNQQTLLGAYLDPIADKIFLTSTFFVQSLTGRIPWWLTILVLSRDVIILLTALVTALATQIRTFPPTMLGKFNTFIQVSTVFVVLVNNAFPQSWTAPIVTGLFWTTAATTLMSAVQYSVNYSRRLQDQPSEASPRKL